MSRLFIDRHRRVGWTLALAAAFALLQPAMGVLSPGLAGWQPGHGHVYTSEAAARASTHTHPYDAGGVHHHDHDHGAAEGTDGASDDGGVVFVFDDGVAGTALPQTSSPTAETPGWQLAPGLAVPAAHAADVPAPLPPPPRA